MLPIEGNPEAQVVSEKPRATAAGVGVRTACAAAMDEITNARTTAYLLTEASKDVVRKTISDWRSIAAARLDLIRDDVDQYAD